MFSFLIRPHNLTTNQFRSVEFQCSVHSTLIPNFMWNFTRKGTSEAKTIANRSRMLSTDYSIIAEQRGQVLIINRVQRKHEGVYKCIVSSNNHQIIAEGNLKVSSKCIPSDNNMMSSFVSFTVPLTQNSLVIIGNSSTPARLDTVTIECNVTTDPPADIEWMERTSKGKKTLNSTQKTFITHQHTNTSSGPVARSILTISNLEVADNGEYICEASNDPSSPSVSASFTICVIGINNAACMQLIHCFSYITIYVP